MKEDKLIADKVNQITSLLKDKKTDCQIGEILAKALDNVNPEKGMLSYYLAQIDIHSRIISFEKHIEFFDKLYAFLKEHHHTKSYPNISEHDSAWIHEYQTGTRGKVRKVIAISNMMGSSSHAFIKEEYFIGEENYSVYYIARAYDCPDKDEFFKDCGRKSLRTLMKSGKLQYFEENYANGKSRPSFDDYESFKFSLDKLRHDYERVVLRYECQHPSCGLHYYFNSSKCCEFALGQLESAYWMRTE